MRTIFLDTFVYALSRAVPAAVGLATVVVLVRLVQEEGYAYFALVFATANAASVLASGWLTQAILRFHVGDGIQSPHEKTALAVSVTLSIVAAVLFTLASITTIGASWITVPLLLLATLLVVSLTLHAIVSALLQTRLLSKGVAKIEILRSVLAFGLAVGLLSIFDGGYVSALLAIALAGFGSAAVGCAILLRSMSTARGEARARTTGEARQLVQEFLRFGAPMSAWMGLSMLYPLVDRMLIQHFLGLTAVGVYAALYDVVFRGCGLLMMPVVLAVHPRIMRAHQESDPRSSGRLILLATRLHLVLAVAIVLTVAIVGARVIGAVLDVDQGTAAPIVVPLAIAGCLWQLALLAHKYLEVKRQTMVMLVAMLIALLVTTSLNIIGLPLLGILAAAYAVVAGGILYACLVAALSWHRYRVDARSVD